MQALTKQFAEELLQTSLEDLRNSVRFKRTRFENIKEAQDMLLGKIRPKVRQQFNVPFPVLSGMYDNLCADLDDPVLVKVKNNPGKNLEAVKGINVAFDVERKSLRTRWDYKDRISRKYAIAYGRGILKYFSSADPYASNLEATDPQYFHCQSDGGGQLENHLFAGEEGILRTKDQLQEGMKQGIYLSEGVTELLELSKDKKYAEKMSADQDNQYSRFKALNLNPEDNNFIGEATFRLCEFVLEKSGERWYVLFDAYTKKLIRAEKLIDIYSGGYYPWETYATHEDGAIFWSTSILGDILYPVADAAVTSLNQDLTNRQKQNLNAKAYDPKMFKNVAELDEAQYRPDALVSADTKDGLRKIQDGLYAFTTPQLTGTIDYVSWLTDMTAKDVGSLQNIPGNTKQGRGKTNNIVFAEVQQLSKRTDYRSHSYTECWAGLMKRYIQGLKDNLSQSEAMDLVGPELGVEFKKNLKLIKLDKEDIQVISTKEQTQEDALAKAQKEKSLDMLAEDQGINRDWYRRHVLSDIGGWDKDEVDDATDMRGLGPEKDQLGYAEEAVKQLLKGNMPEICYTATTIFQRKILDFERSHHVYLMSRKLSMNFLKYVKLHSPIVTENMAQLALRLKALQQQNAQALSQGGQPPSNPSGNPSGNPKVAPKQIAPAPTANAGQPTPINLMS